MSIVMRSAPSLATRPHTQDTDGDPDLIQYFIFIPLISDRIMVLIHINLYKIYSAKR